MTLLSGRRAGTENGDAAAGEESEVEGVVGVGEGAGSLG